MNLVRTGLGLGLGLLLAAGCRQVLGIEERDVAQDGSVDAGDADANSSETDADGDVNATATSECGGFGLPAACASCVDAQCCQSAAACGADPSCSAALACALACHDAACRSRCTAYFRQPNALSTLMACQATSCEQACGVGCGVLSYRVPDCAACMATHHCTFASQCGKNPDCLGEHACEQACPPEWPGCVQECQARYPGGSDFTALSEVLRAPGCAEACNKQGVWSCLGTQTAALTGPGGEASISFTVSDFATGRAYQGTQVKACSFSDVSCASATPMLTDAQGMVTLGVTLQSPGFDGFFELNGDGGNYPALWFPNPPYLIPGWQGRVRFISSSQFLGLAQASVGEPNPSRGHLAILAEDCNFASAPGVSLRVDIADSLSKSFYFAGGLPALSATTTDASGIGGFLDLPIPNGSSRLAYVTMVVPGDLEVSRAAVIKAGFLTTVVLSPTFE